MQLNKIWEWIRYLNIYVNKFIQAWHESRRQQVVSVRARTLRVCCELSRVLHRERVLVVCWSFMNERDRKLNMLHKHGSRSHGAVYKGRGTFLKSVSRQTNTQAYSYLTLLLPDIYPPRFSQKKAQLSTDSLLSFVLISQFFSIFLSMSTV